MEKGAVFALFFVFAFDSTRGKCYNIRYKRKKGERKVERRKLLKNRKKQKRWFLTVLLLFVAIVWGFGFLMTDGAIEKGIPATNLVAYRFLIATIALFLFRAILPKRTRKPFTRHEILTGAISGVMNFFGFFVQAIALKYTDPARCGMLTGVYVIYVPIATLILSKKFRLMPLLNGLIFVVGMVFLTGFKINQKPNVGDMLTLFSAVFFALQIIYIEKLQNTNGVNFTISQMLTMAVLGIVGMLATDGVKAQFTFKDVIAPLLYLGCLSSAFAYVVQAYAQRVVPPTTTAIILSMESLVSVLCALALGEVDFSWGLLFGCLIIAVAFVLSALFEKSMKADKPLSVKTEETEETGKEGEDEKEKEQ